MELFKDFGFEPTFFFAQIVNFLILAFVFKKFMYKPVLKMLKDREKKIAQGLKDADEARLALDKAREEHDNVIRKATIEAEKIIDETKKSAEQTRAELLEKSRSDAQKIIDEAKGAADLEIKKAQDTAHDMSLEVSKRVLSKILDELFTKQEKAKIMTREAELIRKYE